MDAAAFDFFFAEAQAGNFASPTAEEIRKELEVREHAVKTTQSTWFVKDLLKESPNPDTETVLRELYDLRAREQALHDAQAARLSRIPDLSVPSRISRLEAREPIPPDTRLFVEDASRFGYLYPTQELAEIVDEQVRADLQVELAPFFDVKDTSSLVRTFLEVLLKRTFASTAAFREYLQTPGDSAQLVEHVTTVVAILRNVTESFVASMSFAYVSMTKLQLQVYCALYLDQDRFTPASKAFLEKLMTLLPIAEVSAQEVTQYAQTLQTAQDPPLPSAITVGRPAFLFFVDAFEVVTRMFHRSESIDALRSNLNERLTQLHTLFSHQMRYELHVSMYHAQSILGTQAYQSAVEHIQKRIARLSTTVMEPYELEVFAKEMVHFDVEVQTLPTHAVTFIFALEPAPHVFAVQPANCGSTVVELEFVPSVTAFYGFAFVDSATNEVVVSSLAHVTVRAQCARCAGTFVVEEHPKEFACEWTAPTPDAPILEATAATMRELREFVLRPRDDDMVVDPQTKLPLIFPADLLRWADAPQFSFSSMLRALEGGEERLYALMRVANVPQAARIVVQFSLTGQPPCPTATDRAKYRTLLLNVVRVRRANLTDEHRAQAEVVRFVETVLFFPNAPNYHASRLAVGATLQRLEDVLSGRGHPLDVALLTDGLRAYFTQVAQSLRMDVRLHAQAMAPARPAVFERTLAQLPLQQLVIELQAHGRRAAVYEENADARDAFRARVETASRMEAAYTSALRGTPFDPHQSQRRYLGRHSAKTVQPDLMRALPTQTNIALGSVRLGDPQLMELRTQYSVVHPTPAQLLQYNLRLIR